jgi:hypothetical protein
VVSLHRILWKTTVDRCAGKQALSISPFLHAGESAPRFSRFFSHHISLDFQPLEVTR